MLNDVPIYLLRHGQTDWNRDGRLQGWLETDLNATGRAQAALQAKIMGDLQAGLAGARPLTLYSSPLKRAAQTAQIVGDHLETKPVFDDRLREIYMGAWQGLTRSEVAARWPEIYARYDNDFHLSINTIDGESLDALTQRLDSFLQTVSAPSVIVTHGVALQVIRGRLLGLDLAGMADLGHEQAVVYAINSGEERILRTG